MEPKYFTEPKYVTEPLPITMYSNSAENTSYSSFSLLGQQLLEKHESKILKCLDEILRQRGPDDVIILADYGTTDGGNVIEHMNRMIDFIHSVKGKEQEILVILEDQKFNDFNALFQQVKGIHGNKHIKEADSVHLLISGTTMYSKCLPSNSVDFGTSILATHWISNWPVYIQAGVSVYEANDQELALIKKQTIIDWKTFLINRGKEMKSGAYFLVIDVMDSGKEEGPIFHLMSEVLKDMMVEKLISKEEFHRITIPCDPSRSVEDLLQVFSDMDIVGLGLGLVSCRTSDVSGVPTLQKESITASSLQDHGEKMAMYIRNWFYSSLWFGLSNKRDKSNKTEIAEQYFDRLKLYFVQSYWIKGYKSVFGEILFRKN